MCCVQGVYIHPILYKNLRTANTDESNKKSDDVSIVPLLPGFGVGFGSINLKMTKYRCMSLFEILNAMFQRFIAYPYFKVRSISVFLSKRYY